MPERKFRLWQGVLFACVAGLVGEAVEMAQLTLVGMNVPPRLRFTLLAAYAVLGGIAFGLSSLVLSGRRSLALAAAVFGILLILPPLNFHLLPRFLSPQSLLGNALAVCVTLAVATLLPLKLPRITTLMLLAFALVINAAQYLRTGPRDVPVANDSQEGKGPNVLVVLIDTLRADHLGLYGYERNTSPNIDALGRKSLVFDRAITQVPWTKPAVASLLTGQYAHRHGVISSWDALKPGLPTLGTELQRAGYQAAAFSSNPFVSPEFGFDHGFDSFFLSAPVSGVQYTALFRLLTRVKHVVSATTGLSPDLPGLIRAPTERFPPNARRDEILTEELIRWLREHRNARFFVYAHLIGAHVPYDPPDDYAVPFRPAEWHGQKPLTDYPPQVQTIFATAASLPPLEHKVLVAQYDGAIAWTDMLIGRLLQAMGELHLFEQTLLIVTSDHGEEFYDHGNWGHRSRLYNELIRIPLLVHFPGVLPPGRRSEAVMLVDLYPTIAAFAGVPATSAQLDGQDLFSQPPAGRTRVYSEYYCYEGADYRTLAVLEGNKKLIETHDEALHRSRLELFDLANDWGEKRNLTDTEPLAVNPETHHLAEALAAFGREHGAGAATTAKIDAETKERLRALGYQ
jgi:arylsulfatase A-like enzyme